MRHVIFLTALLLLAGCTIQLNTDGDRDRSATGRAGTQQEQAALRQAAERILGQLDREEWQSSWSDAASTLKDVADLDAFTTGVKATRVAFGQPTSRRLKGFNFTTSIDGAPPGDYGIAFFSTTFSRADDVDEHVVLRREEGSWRLAGYRAQKRKRFSLP